MVEPQATGMRRMNPSGTAVSGRARTAATTILRGFMLWYGAGVGVRLGLAGKGTIDQDQAPRWRRWLPWFGLSFEVMPCRSTIEPDQDACPAGAGQRLHLIG